MNFSQLKYIVSVDSERSFSKAATCCHVSQPTLSKEIQKLESKLNVIIFDRTKKPIIPTEKGAKLVGQARSILQEVSRFECLAQANHLSVNGTCTLGVCPSIAPYLLPLFLPNFSESYPNLTIHVKEMSASEILQGLMDDTLDAALSYFDESSRNLYQFEIGIEPYLAYVSEENPLYELDNIELKLAAQNGLLIAKEVLEQLKNKPVIGRVLEKTCSENNLVLESGSLETLRRFVELGKGLTFIPQLASLYMGERRRRYLKRVAEPNFSRKLVLSVARGFHKLDMVTVLKQSIKEGFEQGMTLTEQCD